MLDLAEKIVAGVCGFLVFVTLIFYFKFAVPSTGTAEFLPGVERVAAAAPKDAPRPGDQGPSPEEKAILEKLAQQRKPLPGEKLTTETLRVPEKTFEFISAEANWLPELKKAQSSVMQGSNKNSRLKIYDIQENSLLQKLGLKENDVVELVNGQIIEFSDKTATSYLNLFKDATKKLRDGQSVSVTVTRNGHPVNIEFKL